MRKNSFTQYAASDMLLKNNPVLYEIYPRSFQDLSGDGYGDLLGIIPKLEYLKKLGVTILWLTPFFPSPMKDGGYDITDYCNVAPEAGTLKDFELLVAEAHKLGLQVTIDLVVNHTSDQHPWFMGARSSKDNPKRDWYIWHDPVNGGIPNNWRSVFDPTPWEFDETTGQYYFHSFLKEQPDLNWQNPEVRQAVKDICTFWIKKGVDGFRLDAVNYLGKDRRFPNASKNPDYIKGKQAPFYELDPKYMQDQPDVYKYVAELSEFLNKTSNTYLITEAYPRKRGVGAIPAYQKYYQVSSKKNVIPFNFELIELPWEPEMHHDFISAFLKALDKDDIPVFVLGNHDRPRLVSRIGEKQARAAAVLQLTLPGMPVIYYGEELGMADVRPIPKEKLHDTKELRSPGFGRDPVRTPMQWNGLTYAGFSEVEPWLPLEKDYKKKNVAHEMEEQTSFWQLYKALLQLRSDHADVLVTGAFKAFPVAKNAVLAYQRSFKTKKYLVLMNYSQKKQQYDLPEGNYKQILNSSLEQNNKQLSRTFELLPYEAYILEAL